MLPTDAPPGLAADLRSPLAGIAASLEWVRHQAADRLDNPQRRSLEEALRLCQRAAALTHQIDDGLGPASTRPQTLAIRRVRIDARTLRGAVVEGLSVSLAQRLRWNLGQIDAHADPVWLARTLVRIIGAMQSAEPGNPRTGEIVIEAVDQPEQMVTRWRVSRPEPAAPGGPAMIAAGGPAMAAAAEAAAAGMSDLVIDRDGSVTFITPNHHHFAIAAAYARWRLIGLGQSQRPRVAGLSSTATTTPEVLMSTGSRPRRPDRVAIGSLIAGAACHRRTLERLDRALSQSATVWEWIIRVDTRTWVWALDADHRLISSRLRELREVTDRPIEGLRVTWSEPAIVPVRPRSLETRLIDLIAARSLAGDLGGPAMGLSIDPNRVRAGTEPIRSSDVAGRRLEAELRRMAGRMRQQTGRLRERNRQLRPPN